jgi:tetratricopeptide (TPR) repeat protein
LGNLGRISEALAVLNEADEFARRNGNQIILSRVNGLGWIYREMQDPERSLQYDLMGLEVSRRNKSAEAEANSLINLVYVYTDRGETQKAWDALRSVEAMHDRDPWMRWRFFGIRYEAAAAEHWLARDDVDRATKHARQLLANAIRYQVPKYIAEGHRILAEIAITQGELSLAQTELTSALKLLERTYIPLAAWRTYATLGRLHTFYRNLPSAARAFADAARIVDSIGSSTEDSRLRASFLNSRLVQQVHRGVRVAISTTDRTS